jgi:hypothetical protein
MRGSGQRRRLLSSRFDLIAGIVMIIVLMSAITVGTVLELHPGQGAQAEGDIGTSAGTVLGNGRAATPNPTARPSPTSRPARSSPSPSAGQPGAASQPVPAPVSYASTGPSASGAIANHASTLSWTDNVAGSGTALLVAVAVGQQDDSGQSASATDNGNAMQSLATVYDNGQPDGFLEVFGLAGVPDGANTIRIRVTGGSAAELTGGSESFAGAGPEGTFSAPAAAGGDGTAPAVTIASRPRGLVAGFAACGSAITGTTAPAAAKFIADDNDSTGAGNSAGATSPATGAMSRWPGPAPTTGGAPSPFRSTAEPWVSLGRRVRTSARLHGRVRDSPARAGSSRAHPMGYGVIGSPTGSGPVSLGSSPGTPASAGHPQRRRPPRPGSR